MKTRNWTMPVAFSAVLTLLMTSCYHDYVIGISGEGDLVEETVELSEFSGFVSGIVADIFVSQGDTQEVIIQGQQNIIENINLDVYSGIWTITYHQWVRFAKPVKIYITVPDLTKVGISGSGNITGQTSFADLRDLKLVISGSGNINLEAEAEDIDALISGSGRLNLDGETDTFGLSISGSGDLYGAGLVTREAEVRVSGSGDARLTVEEYMKVVISGSGSVHYHGDPELDVHISGSGRVIHQ